MMSLAALLSQDEIQALDLPSEVGKIVHVGSSSPNSGHAIDAFMRCPAYFGLRYELWALDPDPAQPAAASASSEATIRGSLAHQGLALHYHRAWALQQGRDPDEWAQPLDGVARMAYEKGPAWVENVPHVFLGLRAYWKAWADERFFIAGVEHVVDMAPLLNGRSHTRSIDLVIQGTNGLFYFLDHKFTKKPTETFLNNLAFDGQFLDYQIIGPALLGDKFGGALASIIRWPTDKYRAQILREPVQQVPWKLSRRTADLVWAYKQLDDLRAQKLDPWFWPHTGTAEPCNAFGGCEGRTICEQGPVGSSQYSRLRVVS